MHVKIVPDGEVQGRQSDALAAVLPSSLYDTAWIEFSKSATDLDADNLDKIIVHELLHILMRDQDRIIEHLTEYVGGPLEEHYDTQIRNEQEGVIERLARAIVMFNITLQGIAKK